MTIHDNSRERTYTMHNNVRSHPINPRSSKASRRARARACPAAPLSSRRRSALPSPLPLPSRPPLLHSCKASRRARTRACPSAPLSSRRRSVPSQTPSRCAAATHPRKGRGLGRGHGWGESSRRVQAGAARLHRRVQGGPCAWRDRQTPACTRACAPALASSRPAGHPSTLPRPLTPSATLASRRSGRW